MEEQNNDTPLTLAEARELNFEFGLDANAARELQAELDAAGLHGLVVIELQDGLAELGYPANGGPEDQTVAGKALLIIRGLQGDRDDLRAQIQTLTTDLNDAIARAEKAEGGEKRAKASLTKATTPARPRKLGAIDGKFEDDDDLETGKRAIDKLRAAIDDADEVQIAFSDGTREVPGLDPVNVAGEAWRKHAFGLLLTEAVDVTGPSEGSSVTIDGYALLLDGKQVAYSRRSTPLQVAPGQRVKIADDIIF